MFDCDWSSDVCSSDLQELRAVSNGEPDGEETRDGRRVQRWRVREPMASYLAVVAVGRYETHRTRTARGLPVHTRSEERRVGKERNARSSCVCPYEALG